MLSKNSALRQKFKFKPNPIGWVFIVATGLVSGKYFKAILYQTLELLDIYPESDLWGWAMNILGFLAAYLLLATQMEKIYGKNDI